MNHNKGFQIDTKTYAFLCYSLRSKNNTKTLDFDAAEASVMCFEALKMAENLNFV